ncbi:gamma-glutamyltransferase family protein [Metabacillus arenae]|uniref:Gamma-glutamyltransferase n=1 Tax=Metabacillus arenae TaxID=2771434 RepID=A0A926ND42_9BACI|nr:gamma-glutamyltransferase [Metabacillus arenae]MBD1378940.1 gamma-glutamyltransferase [Metabacillus arenae]
MKQFGISAAHPLAVKSGVKVLENGGNGVDAAIAISFVLGVVEPYASGIGGGGVMLLHQRGQKNPLFYDYRECAPKSGVISEAKVGVPGLVQGLEAIHQKHGKLQWCDLLNDAIDLAENGFSIHSIFHERLVIAQNIKKEKAPHFYPFGMPLKSRERLIQKELAKTLRYIQAFGSSYFYFGELAGKISGKIEGLEECDFHNYKLLKREPVVGSFSSHRLYTAPAPLGGITLIQALSLAEKLKIEQDNKIDFLLNLARIMNECHHDRSHWMGDPDFVYVPETELISESYINKLKMSSNKTKTVSLINEYNHTTHFSIVDQEGMMVSATHTISDPFGSGILIDGFFLNNQLRNFENEAGLPNSPAPGKRPASHIAPSLLFSKEGSRIVIGASGGKRIPTILTLILIKLLKNKAGFKQALSDPRFFIEDSSIYIEEMLPCKEKNYLENLGFKCFPNTNPFFFGGVHGLLIDENNVMKGGADPRRGGTTIISEAFSNS